ncbi:MAG: FAD-dependent oxidoreductase, partial [Methylobacterium sp.]
MSGAEPYRVAVVGAGPGGFYAAEALLRAGPDIRVDLFERLPVPYGLVRFGVAPDHPKLKQVTAVFDRIAAMPGFRFCGGASIGGAVPLEALRAAYHAVILATGAPLGRAVGVPGEGLSGSHSASDFVGWYNGHPDHRHHRFDLSGERAVVVGHGNVALDVARILLKTPDELRHTDIAAHALEALAESRIREVQVVGRGGPAATRFSAKELGEFGTLAECDPALVPGDVRASAFDVPGDADPERRMAIGLLAEFAQRRQAKPRSCVFRFHLEPRAIEGASHVERVVFHRVGSIAEDAQAVVIDCGLVLSSVGRRAQPVTGVPYDAARGIHANRDGRILGADGVLGGLYACGWCKRGPQGTIGTNRACASATVEQVVADLPGLGPIDPDAADDLLARIGRDNGVSIDFAAWKRIERLEVEAGRLAAKPREKLVSIAAMIEAASPARDAACSAGADPLVARPDLP